MNFMYMDETGKNLMTQKSQDVFIFGGLVIGKPNVYDALDVFKGLYQQNRELVRNSLRENVQGPDKVNILHEILDQFEIHAVDLFNPGKNKTRDGKVRRLNPWVFVPQNDIFRLVNSLLKGISPYIERVYMFKADKEEFLGYCEYKGIKATDSLAVELMIRFLLDEYHIWLEKTNKKGAIIPDRLDSCIRDKFVSEIRHLHSDLLWSEPIVVESYSNAFTQIIDIITYMFYAVYKNQKEKAFIEPITKAYNKHVKDHVVIKDLIEYLVEKEKMTVL